MVNTQHTVVNRRWHLDRQIALVVLATLLYVFGLTIYAYHVGLDVNYDLLYYHFYLGWSLVSGHAFTDVFAAEYGSVINPIESLWQYLSIDLLGPRIEILLTNAVYSAAIPSLYVIGRSLYRRFAPASVNVPFWPFLIAAIFGALTPTVISQAGGSMGDALWGAPVLVAFAILAWSTVRGVTAPVVVAVGGLLAFAFSGKLTLGPFALVGASFGVLVILGSESVKKLSLLSYFFASLLVSFALFSGYWLVFMWVHLGDPLFPFLSGLFHSSYSEVAGLINDKRFLPSSFWLGVAYPVVWLWKPTLVSEVGFRDPVFAISYILLAIMAIVAVVCALVCRRERGRLLPVLALLGGFFAIYALWAHLWGIYRYLVVLCEVGPVIAVALVGVLVQRWQDGLRKLIVGAVILAFCVAVPFERPANFGRVPFSSTYFSLTHGVVAHGDTVLIADPTTTLEFALPLIVNPGPIVRIAYGVPGLDEAAIMRHLVHLRAGQRVLVIGTVGGGGLPVMRAALENLPKFGKPAVVLRGCDHVGAVVGRVESNILIVCNGLVK